MPHYCTNRRNISPPVVLKNEINYNCFTLKKKIDCPKDMDENLFKCFRYILETIPRMVSKIDMDTTPLEVMDIPYDKIRMISYFSEDEIGDLYRMACYEDIPENICLNIKELFFITILELGISFKEEESKLYLTTILFSQSIENEDGTLRDAREIRLSTLLKHYYEGDSYSIRNPFRGRVILSKYNSKYYFLVSLLANFLLSNGMLSIDYDEFYSKVNGEDFIKPLDLFCLHLNNDIYYNNFWTTGKEFPNKNMLMAVLSYIKFKLSKIIEN